MLLLLGHLLESRGSREESRTAVLCQLILTNLGRGRGNRFIHMEHILKMFAMLTEKHRQ